ncbi:MAG: hypothetical protein VX960_04605 [Candidatus Neomarinimicrobiota bacterium]|nr:hypothetical protein [Candidatus Neomarinimicrobiota bacterium]
MSTAFRPVSYTALANVTSVSTDSASTGAFAPKSHASVLRIYSSVDAFVNIQSQAADVVADVDNLIVVANEPAHVKVDTVRGEISSINDPGSGQTPVILSQPDNGTAHGFQVGDLVVFENTTNYDSYTVSGGALPTVTAVTNSSAFTVASSGSDVAENTSGTVRKAYKMGIESVAGTGKASVHEVTLQG